MSTEPEGRASNPNPSFWRFEYARWTGGRGGRALWYSHHGFGWRIASWPAWRLPRLDFDNLRKIVAHHRGRPW